VFLFFIFFFCNIFHVIFIFFSLMILLFTLFIFLMLINILIKTKRIIINDSFFKEHFEIQKKIIYYVESKWKSLVRLFFAIFNRISQNSENTRNFGNSFHQLSFYFVWLFGECSVSLSLSLSTQQWILDKFKASSQYLSIFRGSTNFVNAMNIRKRNRNFFPSFKSMNLTRFPLTYYYEILQWVLRYS